jgi:hypothetical protein
MSTDTLDENETKGGASSLTQSKLPYGGGRLLVKGVTFPAPNTTAKSLDGASTHVVALSTNIVKEEEVRGDNSQEIAEKAGSATLVVSPVGEKEEIVPPISTVEESSPLPLQTSEEITSTPPIILPKIANEKLTQEIKHSLVALSLLELLRTSFEKEYDAKIATSQGSQRALLESARNISLGSLSEKERTVFSLAFLMACLSRSGATIIETALILSRKERKGSIAFIKEKIGFKKSAWESLSKKKLAPSAAITLGLAPLISMEILLDIIGDEGFDTKKEGQEIKTETAKDKIILEKSPADKVTAGEDIHTIVRDELLKQVDNVPFTEMRDPLSPFNKKVAWAIEEIQKNVRAYGIEGSIKMLAPGSPVDRKSIAELLKQAPGHDPSVEEKKGKPYTKEDVGSEAIAQGLNTLNTLSGGTMATGRKDETSKEDSKLETSSAVNDAHADEVTVIFLDDNFVKVIKLICKVNDTTALETTFKKYAGVTIKEFKNKLSEEGPIITAEMTTFLTWAKNSYLKDKVALFDNLTLVYVLATIEKGVSGTKTTSK